VDRSLQLKLLRARPRISKGGKSSLSSLYRLIDSRAHSQTILQNIKVKMVCGQTPLFSIRYRLRRVIHFLAEHKRPICVIILHRNGSSGLGARKRREIRALSSQRCNPLNLEVGNYMNRNENWRRLVPVGLIIEIRVDVGSVGMRRAETRRENIGIPPRRNSGSCSVRITSYAGGVIMMIPTSGGSSSRHRVTRGQKTPARTRYNVFAATSLTAASTTTTIITTTISVDRHHHRTEGRLREE